MQLLIIFYGYFRDYPSLKKKTTAYIKWQSKRTLTVNQLYFSDVNMFYLDYFEVTRTVQEIFSSPQKNLRPKQKSKHIQDTGICHIQCSLSQPEVMA